MIGEGWPCGAFSASFGRSQSEYLQADRTARLGLYG